QHIDSERVLTEVEVSLGFEADLTFPRVSDVGKVFPQPVVPVVDTAVDRREHRVNLDARTAERGERLYVLRVISLDHTAMSLHVLRRHRLPLEAEVGQCAVAVKVDDKAG